MSADRKPNILPNIRQQTRSKKVHQLVGLACDIQSPASTFSGVPATGIEPSPAPRDKPDP